MDAHRLRTASPCGKATGSSMLIRLAAKSGIAPILQAGKSGSLDAHDAHVGQED